MDAAQTAIDKVARLSYDMLLLGESSLYREFQKVRQVGEFVGPAFVQYHRYLVANFTRMRAALEGDRETGEAMKAEIYASVEFRRYQCACVHDRCGGLHLRGLGYRISPTVIAKLDSGHRGNVLSVSELLILAQALQIPPVLLLFPTFPDGKVEVLPGQMVDTSRAVGWLSGDSTMETGSPNAGTDLVEAVARLASIDDDLFRLRGMEPLIAKPQVVESMKRVIRDREEQAATVRARIDKAKAAL